MSDGRFDRADAAALSLTRRHAGELFHALLGDFPDGAAMFDDDQLILTANRAFCQIVGRPLDDLVGTPIGDVPDEAASQVGERLARFFDSGSQSSVIPVRTGEGVRRMVSYVAHTDVLPGRHITFIRDITETLREQQEHAVKAGVLDSLEAGVYVVGPDNRISVWNQAAVDITGYAPAEAIGKRVEDLDIADEGEIALVRRRVVAAIRRASSSPFGRPIEISGLRRRKDGSIYPGWAEISLIRDGDEQVVGTLVVFCDASRDRERQRPPAGEGDVGALLVEFGREAIAGRRSPQELLDLALELLVAHLGAELVASWQADARLARVEQEAGRGWNGNDPLGAELGSADAALMVPDAPVLFEEGVDPQGVLAAAGVCSGIVVPIHGHGRGGGLAVYSRSRRRFSPGELEAVAAIAELIGAARARVRLARIEGDLDIARRQASVGALISGVSHDFNNLLSVMLGYARLMESEAQGSELLAEGVAEIENAARQAMQLSRSLVDLGRPVHAVPEQLEVGAVIREVAQLLHRTIGTMIELRVEIGAPDACVLMQPGELDRVIVNLVANSRDAMEGGVVLIRTSIEEAAAEGAAPARPVTIEVIDEGSGMTPEVLRRALEPAFTTKERGEGSGIGLHTADTIVREAGGDLELESEPGQGTTVRIRLPTC